MRAYFNLTGPGSAIAPAIFLAIALGGCGKIKQNDPDQIARAQVQAKRQQSACASAGAYDRLKNLLFDQAVGRHHGDHANLDILADYSVVRMENPVVRGWDPALDIVRCRGRFILEIPPGAERGFAGERRLQADLDYTAQASADGDGFVYHQQGAEPIVARLAAFDLTSGAYRPPPAIDAPETGAPEPVTIARADTAAPAAASEPRPAAVQRPVPPPARLQPLPSAPEGASSKPEKAQRLASAGGSGDGAIRAFYGALGAGNGSVASAQIVPEKRSGRTYSPQALSRFYGRLPEPIRLTGIEPLGPGRYRVRYRYSAGRSRCNGGAIVSLARSNGRDLIRSIQALNGC
jgi:hypothetical protein